MGMSDDSYTVMKLELANLQSVRDFVQNLKAFKSARPLTHLICNAAVYKPTDPKPAFTDDGFEMSMVRILYIYIYTYLTLFSLLIFLDVSKFDFDLFGEILFFFNKCLCVCDDYQLLFFHHNYIKGVNHLGHFLLCNLLIDDMAKAKGARLCIVGSITGNTNTVGGGLVYPQADLGDLQGLESGMKNPISMADGKPFFGAKAYKDSKVCNMMTVSELHNRYHESTGIVFSSMYPGCIAETSLFREKRPWFQKVRSSYCHYHAYTHQ